MEKEIYSNIKDSDTSESFFGCITSFIINSKGVNWSAAFYAKHL